MMKEKHLLKVVKNLTLAKDTIELTLKNKTIAETAIPGQFIYIRLPNRTLRRPISIASVNRSDQTITILFKIVGEGTDELAEFEPGMTLEAIGPNGQGYPVEAFKSGETALLVGGGIGVPPLYFLAQRLHEQGVHIKAVLGFQSADYVFYEAAFQAIGETVVVTDDGSYGQAGFVTDWLDEFESAQAYFSCGPMPMLKAVKHRLPHMKGYLSFEERMGCGIGACYACVIPTHDDAGYKRICLDGPVFRAEEVKI